MVVYNVENKLLAVATILVYVGDILPVFVQMTDI